MPRTGGTGARSSMSWSVWQRVDQAADDFEVAWEASQRPRIEQLLTDFLDSARSVLLHELLVLELGYRRHARRLPGTLPRNNWCHFIFSC